MLEILKPIAIDAGEVKAFALGGQYIEIIEAVDPVDITLVGPAGQTYEMRGVSAGSFSKEAYTNFLMKSATAQTVRLLIASREGGTRRLSGAVTISNVPHVVVDNQTAVSGAFTQAAAAITNVSSVIAAANAASRYFGFQNADAIANVYLNLSGGAATLANGIKVPPGGYFELQGFVTTGAITAIADQPTADGRVVRG